MRYWKSKNSKRVISVDVFMSPRNWEEISQQEFEIIKSFKKKELTEDVEKSIYLEKLKGNIK